MEPRSRFQGLAVFAFATALTAALGSFWTEQSVATWYPMLAKPAWTPPSSVFGPVWTILFVMIAVAGWKAWQDLGFRPKALWTLYAGQLLLNAAWSGLFFGCRAPAWALVDIAALWLLILATTLAFWKHGARFSAQLFVPYLAWVTFAAALNAAIVRLN